MNNLLPARGCIYTATGSDGTGGKGYYALEGLNDSGGGASKVLTIVDSAPLDDSDVVQKVIGIGNKKVLYVFGKDFGNVRVTGRLFLGPAGSSSDGIQKLKRYFETNRVFESRAAVNLSVPGASYKIYLTGFAVGQPDPEYHIQPFVISGLIADPLA